MRSLPLSGRKAEPEGASPGAGGGVEKAAVTRPMAAINEAQNRNTRHFMASPVGRRTRRRNSAGAWQTAAAPECLPRRAQDQHPRRRDSPPAGKKANAKPTALE